MGAEVVYYDVLKWVVMVFGATIILSRATNRLSRELPKSWTDERLAINYGTARFGTWSQRWSVHALHDFSSSSKSKISYAAICMVMGIFTVQLFTFNRAFGDREEFFILMGLASLGTVIMALLASVYVHRGDLDLVFSHMVYWLFAGVLLNLFLTHIELFQYRLSIPLPYNETPFLWEFIHWLQMCGFSSVIGTVSTVEIERFFLRRKCSVSE
ncbi:MAG: hypothetical protein Alpg2KO_04100 [Alphaproteobacteria bacterium]